MGSVSISRPPPLNWSSDRGNRAPAPGILVEIVIHNDVRKTPNLSSNCGNLRWNGLSILGSIDFYKVGHHGSTNATPIPAVSALNQNCVAMCSTAVGACGPVVHNSEVPRIPLIKALEKQTRAGSCEATGSQLSTNRPRNKLGSRFRALPKGFTTPGEFYIDYEL